MKSGTFVTSGVPPNPMQEVESPHGKLYKLAKRECEILRLAAGGAADKEIAAELGIGVGTVRNRLTEINTKLGFESRLQAALWVLCHDGALKGHAVPREPRIPPSLHRAA